MSRKHPLRSDATPARGRRQARRTTEHAGAVTVRPELLPEDIPLLLDLLARTGRFREAELAVAAELMRDRLTRGPASDYRFLVAEAAGTPVGFACHGPIPATDGRHDLYWIAVDPRHQRRGIGTTLLRRVEEAVRADGGRRIYVETSTQPAYGPTRAFYRRHGYRRAATLADFYAEGDGKAIYCRDLGT
ncbi:GNAT family N-acetyltransferase [Inmirania thermothiophila]|uniref:Acetyltransferase (GNAT) family protein n=1 Tax=Inmirania thermothiophila TaxID=1750597 RepID=A0A3N1Y8Q1_9GAMM|nr:GNAT family N-acetyltransferase [Inmirania thermothiophila]ROR35189.1 acetyltransferase (GNAT) family protein [Inmirania thermothiophila]